MDCSTPGLPVHHQLPEFTWTHVHWVGDVIQPSHPLSSPPPAFNLSQHQGLFKLAECFWSNRDFAGNILNLSHCVSVWKQQTKPWEGLAVCPRVWPWIQRLCGCDKVWIPPWQGLGPTGHPGILKQEQVLGKGDRSPGKGPHLNSGLVVLCQLDIVHFLSKRAPHTEAGASNNRSGFVPASKVSSIKWAAM